MNVRLRKHALIENARTPVSINNVGRTLSVSHETTGQSAHALRTAWGTPTTIADRMSAFGTQIVQTQSDARMRSVLTPASVPGMLIVMHAITEDTAPVFLTILEIRME